MIVPGRPERRTQQQLQAALQRQIAFDTRQTLHLLPLFASQRNISAPAHAAFDGKCVGTGGEMMGCSGPPLQLMPVEGCQIRTLRAGHGSKHRQQYYGERLCPACDGKGYLH